MGSSEPASQLTIEFICRLSLSVVLYCEKTGCTHTWREKMIICKYCDLGRLSLTKWMNFWRRKNWMCVCVGGGVPYSKSRISGFGTLLALRASFWSFGFLDCFDFLIFGIFWIFWIFWIFLTLKNGFLAKFWSFPFFLLSKFDVWVKKLAL